MAATSVVIIAVLMLMDSFLGLPDHLLLAVSGPVMRRSTGNVNKRDAVVSGKRSLLGVRKAPR